jgi:cell division transport system permease protein
MNINAFKYGLRQSFLSLRRNIWLATVTAGIIAISLAILGGFLLLAVNADQVLRNIETNVEIGVFLEDGTSPGSIETLLSNHDLVHSFVFVSKEEGLEEFGRTMGDRVLLAGLEGDNNPLPDLFRVKARSADDVAALAADIRLFPGVETVDYGEELVGQLLRVTNWLNNLLVGMSSMLALAAIFLIVTTIRLSVLARQDEVGIMKYLGASNGFIRFPFLLEGMVMGWAGTLAAIAALGAVYFRLTASLQQEALTIFIQPVTDLARLLPVFGGLLLLGTLMGGIGSFVSVRKFLRV